MSNKLNELDLDVQSKAVKTIAAMKTNEKLKSLGVETVYVNETKRSLSTQMAYYARGRMNYEDVKRLYNAIGIYTLTEEEAKQKITWTLDSKHIKGRAIDIVPVKNGKLWWTAPKEVWETMGLIGEANGLTWGGRWKDTPDTPHFEA